MQQRMAVGEGQGGDLLQCLHRSQTGHFLTCISNKEDRAYAAVDMMLCSAYCNIANELARNSIDMALHSMSKPCH